jgi:PEP-CTERM motif
MFSSRPAGAWAPIALSLGLFAVGANAGTLTEGFEAAVPAGWTVQNNSSPVGPRDWFQGVSFQFDAHAGPVDSFAAANFNSTTGAGTISTWLISPTLSFDNGDVVSFWTRTTDGSAYPDRLELRFSSVGGIDVGTSPTDTGTFGLLVSVNPTLALSGYPEVWTQYSATISGLAGTTDGAIAFRYFVTDGGSNGLNSNYIGIDTLTITPVPEPATFLLMAMGVAGVMLRRKPARRCLPW